MQNYILFCIYFDLFKVWKEKKQVLPISFCYGGLSSVTFYSDLGGAWVAFEVFLMLEIDVDGSLSSFEFLREIVGLVSSN